MTNITRYGVLNDIHGPWHCPRTLELILDIFEDMNLNGVYLNGDIFDFANISRHKKKDPRIQGNLEDSLYWGNEFFSDIRKRFVNKGTKVHFLRGNHEEWLDTYLNNKAPQFWNLCALEKMVNLDGITVSPYNLKVQVEKANLYIQHSPPSYAETGPMTSLKKKVDSSFIWGCSHRMGMSSLTGGSGNVYYGYFNGWLGSTSLSEEHFQVFKYMKGHESWQKCASIVTVVGQKEFFVEQFALEGFKAAINGYLYEG